MVIALTILIFSITGFVAYELVRRSKRFAWLFSLALPLGLTPYWVVKNQSDADWFFFAKLYLIAIPICFWVYSRYSNSIPKQYTSYIFFIFLVTNILLAGSKSFTSNTLAGYFNVVNAILLIAILPPPKRSIFIDYKSQFRDLIWDLSPQWILAYTVWDATFIYINFPNTIIHSIPNWLAPLIVCLFNWKLWVQARGVTLLFFLMATFTFQNLNNMMVYDDLKIGSIQLMFSIASLIWVSFLYIQKKISTHS